MNALRTRATALLSLSSALAFGPVATAQESSLAEYFGFDPLEIVRIDPGAGPLAVADVDGDGLTDLVAVNNFKSRIEVHRQRANASPDDVESRPTRVNEIPEHWRFERIDVPLQNRVTGLVVHDLDDDGRLDIVTAGLDPAMLVFLRQTESGRFEITRRHFETGLVAGRDGIVIANLLEDEAPELAAIVKGRVKIWSLAAGSLREIEERSAGDVPLVAIMVEDFDGDGGNDLLGVAPDDAAPLRLWLSDRTGDDATLGPQRRFEMPALRESLPVRVPGEAGALIATVEKPTRRVVLSRLAPSGGGADGDREASYVVHAFGDPGNRQRRVALTDLDVDGVHDVVATNTAANAISIFRGRPDAGIGSVENAPAFAELADLATGDLDGDGVDEIVVVSAAEGVVGLARVESGELQFPEAIALSAGYEPLAASIVEVLGRPHMAIVAKESRRHQIELIDGDGERTTVDLGPMSRSPESVVSVDADRDGREDLLLLIPDRAPQLLLAQTDGTLAAVESAGQEKLLRAASASNALVFDLDGDGLREFVIADRNFVRGLRFERASSDALAGGWQVVDQINATNDAAKLSSVVALGRDRLVAADRENGRLVIFDRLDDRWRPGEEITLRGFRFDQLLAGDLSGDGSTGLAAVGDGGFAVVDLAGDAMVLEEVANWSANDPRRVPHELALGDLNSDGFLDLSVLDAGEQSVQVLSISESMRLLPAVEFEVFESKLFSGGDLREFEPREAHVVDLTGDGLPDLVLLAHDRVLLYPQQSSD